PWDAAAVSLHYQLLIEMDLVEGLPDEDLSVVRWLIGLGEEPQKRPQELEPLLAAADLIDHDDPASTTLPGGATSVMRQRLLPSRSESRRVCWSLAVRTLVLDDSMYESGLAALAWLGRHSFRDGFIAIAREELDVVPGWVFASYSGWTYLIAAGEVGPLDQDAPEPPESLMRTLNR
ncbi:MAG: hypothetical protein ACJ716_06590, partial [Marmoricola sp.]